MRPPEETADDAPILWGSSAPRTPGLVHVYTPPSPRCFVTLYPDKGEPLILGRDPSCGLVLADDKLVSRTHCSLHAEGAELVIRDRKSSHGVYLDGARIAAAARVNSGERHVLRIGASVFLLEPDVERFGKPGAEMALLRQEPGFDDAIAGPAIFKAWSDAALAAHMKRPLFVAGESGTGKERVARIYHARGPRARGPFVAINCAVFAASTVDAELFGQVKGAFTGAHGPREGAFRRAHQGVLFLDEVGELSLEVQAKLLRVLQDGSLRPLGSDEEHHVDVLVVCATNRDLKESIAKGQYRQDLWERIVRGTVLLPPLRERPEEIPHLAALFAKKLTPAPLSGTFIETCLLCAWPGNIRALARVVETAATENVLRDDGTLDFDPGRFDALLATEKERPEPRTTPSAIPPPSPSPSAPPAATASRAPAAAPADRADRPMTLHEINQRAAIAAYETHGILSRAAAELGISRNRVRRMLIEAGVYKQTSDDDEADEADEADEEEPKIAARR